METFKDLVDHNSPDKGGDYLRTLHAIGQILSIFGTLGRGQFKIAPVLGVGALPQVYARARGVVSLGELLDSVAEVEDLLADLRVGQLQCGHDCKVTSRAVMGSVGLL